MEKIMIGFIRKYFNNKQVKPEMYIYCHSLKDGEQYGIIIHDNDILKEYRISNNNINSNSELVLIQILLIILKEDITTVYFDPWNLLLIEPLARLSFIKLVGLRGDKLQIIKELKNEVKQNDITYINILKD